MPTSRYEGYTSPDQELPKEKIIGEDRLQKLLGEIAIAENIDNQESSADS